MIKAESTTVTRVCDVIDGHVTFALSNGVIESVEWHYDPLREGIALDVEALAELGVDSYDDGSHGLLTRVVEEWHAENTEEDDDVQ